MRIKGNSVLYKQNLIRYGLYGFVTGIIAFLNIMALHIPHSIFFSAESTHRSGKALGEFLDIAPVFFFLAALVSFGIMFTGILMKPRTFPVRTFMKTFTRYILLAAFWGGGFFTVIILGSLSALFVILFMEKHTPVFMSLGFFSGALLLLLLSFIADRAGTLLYSGGECGDDTIENSADSNTRTNSAPDRSLSYAEKTSAYTLTLLGTALIHGNEIRVLLSSIRTEGTVTPVILPDIFTGAVPSLALIFMSSLCVLKSFKIMRRGKHP
ncbi:MAG TPA: hypothetical protein PK253_04650 [Spirochaetota bacterium]|nr:hypothetical protein [Spirochaetota bacterium]